MTATVTQIPVPVGDSASRRSVRDQDETVPGYLSRIGQSAGPASAKTISRALDHYSGELAIAEIFAAGVAQGWAQCEAAMAARPHLTLAGVTAAGVDAIQEASR
jgi:hypothetical protein